MQKSLSSSYASPINGLLWFGTLVLYILNCCWYCISKWQNRRRISIPNWPADYKVVFYIVRHCEKVPSGDLDPPLTSKGQEQALKIGQGIGLQMSKMGQATVTAILTSPFRRTVETACGIRRALEQQQENIKSVAKVECEWMFSEATLQNTKMGSPSLLTESILSKAYSSHLEPVLEADKGNSIFSLEECQKVYEQLQEDQILTTGQWQVKRIGMMRYAITRWLQRWLLRQKVEQQAENPCSTMVFILVTHGTVFTDLITSILLPSQFPPYMKYVSNKDWVDMTDFENDENGLILFYRYVQKYFPSLEVELWDKLRVRRLQKQVLQGATTMLVASSSTAAAEHAILQVQPERLVFLPAILLQWCIQNDEWPIQ